MELKKDKVLKDNVEFMPIKDFIDKFHPGLKSQSINYAIKNDKVDFMKIGRERFVVMTEKTKKYHPINHPSRV